MAVRLSGLSSGLDTEAIIKELMSAQSLRKTNIEKKLTKLEWKEDKWKELNLKLYNLYKDEVAKLKSQGSYLTKSVSTTDDSKVSVTAGSKVPAGTHTVSIDKVASAQYITGNTISTLKNGQQTSMNGSTKITDVCFKNGSNEGYIASGTMFNLEVDGQTKHFTVGKDTTIDDLSKWFKNEGIAFSYDSTHQRFYMNSLQSGEKNSFQLTSSFVMEGKDSSEQISNLRQYVGIEPSQIADGSILSPIKDKLKDAEAILQHGTGSSTLAQNAKNVYASLAKAKQDVYRNYMQNVFESELEAAGASKENYELRWKSDGSYTVYDKEAKKEINDYNSALSTASSSYDFTSALSDNKYAESYLASFSKNMKTLNASQNSLANGMTAGSILGLTDGNVIENNFAGVDKTDILTHNIGGANALLGLADSSEIELAMNNYRNGVDTENAKNTIEKYAKADDIAQKEVYKSYIEKSWNKVIGTNTDFALEWEADGTYNITKVNEDSELSLASYRQKLNDYKNTFDFDTVMTGEDQGTYQQIYKEKYQAVVDGSYSGFTTKVDLTNTFASIEAGTKALDIMGIGENTTQISEDTAKDSVSGARFIKASNMVCTLNGCEYINDSNSVTINGLTINAIAETTSPVRVTVSNNSDAVYKMVDNFVKKYNEVLQSVNDLYYAASAKGYDVLTDEEKELMSEKQIEKWEDKIKDSLLRRDSTLNSILSTLRSVTSETTVVNGKTYSLSSFGINTGAYTERGLLHIDGNSEDPSSADVTDKLKKALEEDPETVMQALSSIGEKLYSKLADRMASSKLSSALTFYNDKEIANLKKDYNEQITAWQKKLKTMEDKYYKQFSAMESAMAKLNSQTSYFSSLFGTN